jgi:hypothetical protein
MSDAQLELAARIYFKDTASSFAPYLAGWARLSMFRMCWSDKLIVRMWLDAIMLGCLFILYGNWAQRGFQSERLFTKLLLVSCLVVSAEEVELITWWTDIPVAR